MPRVPSLRIIKRSEVGLTLHAPTTPTPLQCTQPTTPPHSLYTPKLLTHPPPFPVAPSSSTVELWYIFFRFSNIVYQTLVYFQKSSLPSIAPPCECLNVGFQNCMLNPAGFCNCSAGCSFVQNFLTEAEKNATAIYDNVEMVTMRKFSGVMTPINGEASIMTPSLLQDSLQVSIHEYITIN